MIKRSILMEGDGMKDLVEDSKPKKYNISPDNFNWFIKRFNEVLKGYYQNEEILEKGLKGLKELKQDEKNEELKQDEKNVDLKTMDDKKFNIFFNSYINYVNQMQGDNSQYLYFGILEKLKPIFEVQYSQSNEKGIKMTNDRLNNFYKLMGRYPKPDDMKEYRNIYERIQENLNFMENTLDTLKSSLYERRYFSPSDYFPKYMGGWFFKVEPNSRSVLAVESDTNYGQYAKEFLNKCFAYKELSLLAKDNNATGNDVAKEIVGNTSISQEDIEHMFLCIHLNNPRLNSGTFRSLIMNNDFNSNYVIGQPFDVSRFVKHNYLNIFKKGSNEFVGSIDVISYDKLRDLIRELGNFPNFINKLTSSKMPDKI